MKRSCLILLLYICFIAMFLFAIFLLPSLPSIKWKPWVMPKGELPVAASVYERDKRQIEESYLNNLEYVRTHYDSCKDPAYFYHGFVSWHSLKVNKYIASPFEARKTCKIMVDTIVYDKSGLKCIAFIEMKEIRLPHPDFEDNCIKNREYSARAMAGLREKVEDRMQMYPLRIFQAAGFDYHHSAAKITEEMFYTELDSQYGSSDTSFKDQPYGVNVGDPAFFEKTPIFQKFDRKRLQNNYEITFDDTLYNCQVYCQNRTFYKYDYPY